MGDVRDEAACRRWLGSVDAVAHLAASISVQDSIDDPATTFDNDVVGTFRLLEAAKARRTRFLFMSTCMVYDRATGDAGIDEEHATRPASPYAASKLSGEALALSYGHAYGLPVSVVRPFNTYGPYQRSVGEGGVVAIFTRRSLLGEPLQHLRRRDPDAGPAVRDRLRPVRVRRPRVAGGGPAHPERGDRPRRVGQRSRRAIEPDPSRIVHVEHIHPQSEIAVLRCDPGLAKRLLGWQPEVTLADGLAQVRSWMADRLAVGMTVG